MSHGSSLFTSHRGVVQAISVTGVTLAHNPFPSQLTEQAVCPKMTLLGLSSDITESRVENKAFESHGLLVYILIVYIQQFMQYIKKQGP